MHISSGKKKGGGEKLKETLEPRRLFSVVGALVYTISCKTMAGNSLTFFLYPLSGKASGEDIGLIKNGSWTHSGKAEKVRVINFNVTKLLP